MNYEVKNTREELKRVCDDLNDFCTLLKTNKVNKINASKRRTTKRGKYTNEEN